MPISDLFSHPQLIFRIVEKQKRGSEYSFETATGGSFSDLILPESRYNKQRRLHSKESGNQTEIARFTFPINREGKTFFYNDYQLGMNLRTNVTDGIAGTISEIYGRGIDEISMRGVFPKAGERSVILSTEFVPELETFEPRDWVQSFKEFIQYYADLNDPYSRLWTDEDYTKGSQHSINTFKFVGVDGDSTNKNKSLYEFQIIDEYAEQIFSVIPRNPRIYGNESQPLSFAWSIDFTVIEDKMQAPYKQIPDDVLDLVASFRVPEIDEIPVIGTLSTLMDKIISISNSVAKSMETLSSYSPKPKFANDVNKFNTAISQIATQAATFSAQVHDTLGP